MFQYIARLELSQRRNKRPVQCVPEDSSKTKLVKDHVLSVLKEHSQEKKVPKTLMTVSLFVDMVHTHQLDWFLAWSVLETATLGNLHSEDLRTVKLVQ